MHGPGQPSVLARGGISGARLRHARAAEAGRRAAALAMGRSDHAAGRAGPGLRGIRPDPERAALWYRRAEAPDTAR